MTFKPGDRVLWVGLGLWGEFPADTSWTVEGVVQRAGPHGTWVELHLSDDPSRGSITLVRPASEFVSVEPVPVEDIEALERWLDE